MAAAARSTQRPGPHDAWMSNTGVLRHQQPGYRQAAVERSQAPRRRSCLPQAVESCVNQLFRRITGCSTQGRAQARIQRSSAGRRMRSAPAGSRDRTSGSGRWNQRRASGDHPQLTHPWCAATRANAHYHQWYQNLGRRQAGWTSLARTRLMTRPHFAGSEARIRAGRWEPRMPDGHFRPCARSNI